MFRTKEGIHMFYKTGVDIASTKSMWEFLHNHFTYYTMNSWNRQTSIAHNVKLYNLKLEGDWTATMRYLFDEADSGFLQLSIDDMIREFEEANPYYKVFFNGRSGGYLVLCNSDNGSVLPACITEYDSYEEFKEDVKGGWNGYKVSDFDYELREAVEIVREFDKLCDRLRDLVNEYSKRSFDVDKLEDALTRFGDEYGDDLEALEITGPVMEGDRVKLNEIADYAAFMHCFANCLGEDQRRAAINNGYLWLKEN
jgi:hypothetical protein